MFGGGVVCVLGIKCGWWQDYENSQRLINKFTSGTLANAVFFSDTYPNKKEAVSTIETASFNYYFK